MPDIKVCRLKRAVIKQEYVAITGNMTEALILNQMIYWSERVKDFDDFINEERARQTQTGNNPDELPLLCGWIHKSAGELKEEIMSSDSPKTILRKLDSLVSKGFLDRRRNPNSRYDHVYQYRVNFMAILAALSYAGYSLEGYRVEFNIAVENSGSETLPNHPRKTCTQSSGNDLCWNGQNEKTNGQTVLSKSQNIPSEGQGVLTIPETITEITTETTSSPSYSPEASELDSFFETMGIDRLKRQELIAPMKEVIADLWRTHRVGKTIISRETVKKAFSYLSPEIIEGIFDKFDRQRKKGQIVAPAEYIKALILNAPKDMELLRAVRVQSNTGSPEDGASFDIDEFVRLSMAQVHGE